MSFEKQRKIIRNHILGFGKEKLLEISHFYHTLPSFHYCSNFTIHLNDNALYLFLALLDNRKSLLLRIFEMPLSELLFYATQHNTNNIGDVLMQ